jgi:hypothetical protein
MRARQPDRQDFVERNGIKVGFEVYDGGQPADRCRRGWL